MRHISTVLFIIALFNLSGFAQDEQTVPDTPTQQPQPSRSAQQREPVVPATISLPVPASNSDISVEQVMLNRGKTVRYVYRELSSAQISQLLWSAYGYSDVNTGRRVLFSADNQYSLEMYLVTPNKAYKYKPLENVLEVVRNEDVRTRLASSSDQTMTIRNSVCNIVIAGSAKLAGAKFPRKGKEFMLMEAGRACQNIELAAIRMGLGVINSVRIDEKKIKTLLQIGGDYEPVAIVSVGSLNAEYGYTFEKIAAGAAAAAKTEQAKSSNILIIIPDRDFIEEDFFGVTNIFAATGVSYTIASSTLDNVRGNLRGEARPDVLVREVDMRNYDGVILIGGGKVLRQYTDESRVIDIAQACFDSGKPVGAIGRAVRVLVDADLVRGRRVTGDPSIAKAIKSAGGSYVNIPAQASGNVLSAQSTAESSRVSSSEGSFGVLRFARMYVDFLRGVTEPEPDTRTSPFLKGEEYEKQKL